MRVFLKTMKSNSDKLKHRAKHDSKERVQCYVEYIQKQRFDVDCK